MDYYRPTLANNQFVPLALSLKGFKINFLWPLQEHATRLQRYLRIFGQTCLLITYIATLLAEMTFIQVNLHNDLMIKIEAISFLVLGSQYFIRILVLGQRQTKMRNFFEYFFKQIYFTSADDSVLYGKICKIMRIIGVITVLYCMPMVMKLISMSIELSTLDDMQSKPFIFPFAFAWYDAQAPVAYIITTFYTVWHPISFLSLRAAEDYLLCLVLLHTSYRYKELQQELPNMLMMARLESERVGGSFDGVHALFRKKLYNVFQRQQRLDIFVNMVKSYLSYHVFLSISFGVALLCIICFRMQMVIFDEEWFRCFSFTISQTLQFLMLGHFGQMLFDETSAMHDSYYMCQWEQLLTRDDASSNIELMNDIKVAILRAEHGSVLTGMKMFPLTHETVLLALRKAASFFMFLKTIND